MPRLRNTQVTHSTDAMTIELFGDHNNPEPSTIIVKMPHGIVEVCRCSDGTYRIHGRLRPSDEDGEFTGTVVGSRVDYKHGAGLPVGVLPDDQQVSGYSIKVGGLK
jgi:hypothetical protein